MRKNLTTERYPYSLSESLAEGGFEPLTIGSMRKNLTTERYPYSLSESLAEGGFEPLTIGSMCKNLTTDSYHDTLLIIWIKNSRVEHRVDKDISKNGKMTEDDLRSCKENKGPYSYSGTAV